MKDPETNPGTTPESKYLHNDLYRDKLEEIHNRTSYYLYMASVLRYLNAVKMNIIGVSEETIKEFIKENQKETSIDKPIPYQQDFLKPPMNYESLPDFESWINEKRV